MSDCGRDCGCSSTPSRRDILKIGIGTAGAMAGARNVKAAPGEIPASAKIPPPEAWFDELEKPGGPIVYSGPNLKNIIFPLGGIGTGTVWLNGSGRLVNWQIFNNIQKNTFVDDTFFAVRIEQEGKPPILRVLQEQNLGAVAGIENIRFHGQYPYATISFTDPELPADLELEAFNPLIPLDEKDSGIPCAIVTLRARNKTDTPLRISFLGSLQNAVAHAGAGASNGTSHPSYGGNINALVREERFAAIAMHAEPGKPPQIDPPVEVFFDHYELPILAESPVSGLSFTSIGVSKNNAAIKTLYWLANGDLRLLGGSLLSQIGNEVRELGAVLLLSGVNNPLQNLVRATLPEGTTRRETILAGFDDAGFGKWKVEGNAFQRPYRGTAVGQNPVTGFIGAGFVNSFDGSDDLQGSLTSPPFTIKEKYISFLIGGGQHPGACCMNLKIGGKVVRTATGKSTEQLERTEWDVADLVNQEAEIEIVDRQGGSWGHILVDDIRLSNLPTEAVTFDEAAKWNALLEDARQAASPAPANVGRGKVVIIPVELGRTKPGMDQLLQRDQLLQFIASLAGSKFKPASGRPGSAPSFGTMCLATPDAKATTRTAWAGHERDALLKQWQEIGHLDQGSPAKTLPVPSGPGQTFNGALCVSAAPSSGGTFSATFILTWHFPNNYYPQNSWRLAGNTALAVGNMYANWYHDALSVAKHVVADLPQLRAQSENFRKAMFDTTLPQYLVDAVASNISILRSPTCFWIKDGTFYGFEGCVSDVPEGGGCCPMNCNHVWNYEQTLAKLWPELERNMRVTELKYHQQENGGIHHRVEVPRTDPTKRHFPVADGQCGAVLKAYREHLQSADRRFLDDHWPLIKKAMDYAISEWDADSDGVMEKPQFNTYDRVIYGHNTFVTSLYLAALRAAEEMAKLVKESVSAERYRDLFEKGRKLVSETLFEGEYYIQKADNINLGYGTGCFSDQVVGQWWSCVLNLGDILPKEQVHKALAAIFKNNWLWNQEGFQGTQRFLQFADGKDMSLLVCTWPKGGRPEDPILYRDECWTGQEYQVAAHKIYEGQVAEGLAIVRGARGRYDGKKKSPWNEIECGDYYARALSSWSLLLAAQGYQHNGSVRSVGFDPRVTPHQHRSFFTTATGWGTFEQRRDLVKKTQTDTLAFLAGRCDIEHLQFGLPKDISAVKAQIRLGERELLAETKVADGFAMIELNAPVTAISGQSLTITLNWA